MAPPARTDGYSCDDSEYDVFRTHIGRSIFDAKYKHDGANTWSELSRTLVEDVCGKYLPRKEVEELVKLHTEMKFIAGGRYLYYAGRPAKYFNNCFLLKAEEDTREDWANLSHKVESCLTTGGGIGVDYSVYRASGSVLSRTGGFASGPISKMRMMNEIGREVMQGSSRRSALYGSLNWQHGDAKNLLYCKDWYNMPVSGAFDASGKQHTVGSLKESDFNYKAPLDMTNISLNYDNAFLKHIYGIDDADELQRKLASSDSSLSVTRESLPSTFVENCKQALKTGEPGFSFNFFDKEKETLRNAPLGANTRVLTIAGYKTIRDLMGDKVDTDECGDSISVWTGIRWAETRFRRTRKNSDTLNIYLSNGNVIEAEHSHEFIVRADPDGADVEAYVTRMQHTKRVRADRLAVGDSLAVIHPNTSLLFKSNILSELDTVTVAKITEGRCQDVFCCDVGAEEHAFMAEGVLVSNCTEVTSEDDGDVCNLASVNLSRIESLEEMKRACYLVSRFLLCGTMVALLPYDKVYEVRKKNRRLGLGLMGIHEWLLRRNYKYEVVPELHEWLQAYKDESEYGANELADKLNISRPKGYRSIAPTGTIGILAGTTTGIEPLYAVAYKRRYLSGDKQWMYQYVIDGTAKILIEQYGVDPDKIDTALSLSTQYEKRIKFQADVQQYVDMSISSTINLPKWGSDENNEDMVDDFAITLARYAHRIRGITVYPDGARGGQPLTSIPYEHAKNNENKTFMEEYNDICTISGKGGVCGL